MEDESKKTLFNYLKQRGFVYQSTDEKKIEEELEKNKTTFYIGIDPTASSLHIGHFFSLRMFKLLQDAGHRGIIVIGGATAMVGDPTGKSDMRKMLSKEQIKENVNQVKKIIKKFVNTQGENPAIILDNTEWISKFSYIDFLREVGIHFSINNMLSSEAYSKRIGQGGLSFLELGYMPMQAYDFVHLNREYGCKLQIGGSDQWGNIVAGTMLNRKMNYAQNKKETEVYGLTAPLLMTREGKKMGKTEKGTLWVENSRVSAFDFYQYFYNVSDDDVELLLKLFTDIEIEQIKKMCSQDIIQAKRKMAYELTKMVHGEQMANSALKTADSLFKGDGDVKKAPKKYIDKEYIQKGIKVLDLLNKTEITSSKGEARRLIKQGGIYISNKRVDSVDLEITQDMFNENQLLIRKGKKKYFTIVQK